VLGTLTVLYAFQIVRPLQSVRQLDPETWVAKDVGAAPGDPLENRSTPITLRVGGKQVTFGLKGAFSMSGKWGKDGSIIWTRHYRQISWTDESTVWYKGVETPVPYTVEAYIDRKNHAGSAFDGPMADPSQIPPRAYATVGGKRSELGWGRVIHMSPRGLFVVLNQSTTPSKTTIFWNGPPITVPAANFIGEFQDGTLAFASGSQVFAILPGKRHRKRHLPLEWTVVAAAPGGWMLVSRRSSGTHELGILEENGLTPLQFGKSADVKAVLDSMDSVEMGSRAFRVPLKGRAIRFSARKTRSISDGSSPSTPHNR